MQSTTQEAGDIPLVEDVESSYCLICNSRLILEISFDIFRTSMPRSGELLAAFIFRILRPFATDLRGSYLCPRCYNLVRALEQAQWTASSLRRKILGIYRVKDCTDEIKIPHSSSPLSQNSTNPDEKPSESNEFREITQLRLVDETSAKNIIESIRDSSSVVTNFHAANVKIYHSKESPMSSEERNLDYSLYADCEEAREAEKAAIRMENFEENLGESRIEARGKSIVREDEKRKFSKDSDSKVESEERNFDYSLYVDREEAREAKNAAIEGENIEETPGESRIEATGKKIVNESRTREFSKNSDSKIESEAASGDKVENTNEKSELGSRRSGGISRYGLELLKYSCETCDKKWRTSAELRTHVKSHSSLRPYVCEKCGQAYKRRNALEIHLGMHNGVSPFRCNVCDKCFTQKGALMRHLPMHTGEKPYQCELCGKRFVHHTSYNMHALSHTGKKSYQCHVCELSLLSTSHLKRHMRVHTGEKPYSCSLCDKSFAERYNLFAHQKIHDPAEIIAKAAAFDKRTL